MSALNPFADLSGYAGSAPALNRLWIKVSGIPAVIARLDLAQISHGQD